MSWLLLLFVMLLALLLMLLLCSSCSSWFVDYDAVDDCVIVGYEFAVVVGCDVPDVLHLCCIMIWNVRVVVYVYICWRSILLRYWEFIRSQNILAMVLLNFESSCFSLLLNLLFSFCFIVLYSDFAMKYLSLKARRLIYIVKPNKCTVYGHINIYILFITKYVKYNTYFNESRFTTCIRHFS